MTLDELEQAILDLVGKYRHDVDKLDAAIEAAFDDYDMTREPECVLPARKTGVIVGAQQTQEWCEVMTKLLRHTYPHVTLTVIPGAQSVAFEWVEA